MGCYSHLLGKSRLIEEFHTRLREVPHTWVGPWSVDDPESKLGQECYFVRDGGARAGVCLFRDVLASPTETCRTCVRETLICVWPIAPERPAVAPRPAVVIRAGRPL